jgi:hypothetical protein
MKALLAILVPAAILFHVAGQIYLVSYAIGKSTKSNIFFKIVIGIFCLVLINIPGLTASVLLSQRTAHVSPLSVSLSVVFCVWGLGISCFGFFQIIRDYWLLYKRKS